MPRQAHRKKQLKAILLGSCRLLAKTGERHQLRMADALAKRTHAGLVIERQAITISRQKALAGMALTRAAATAPGFLQSGPNRNGPAWRLKPHGTVLSSSRNMRCQACI
jgi:hypothetical protein